VSKAGVSVSHSPWRVSSCTDDEEESKLFIRIKVSTVVVQYCTVVVEQRMQLLSQECVRKQPE
jgi:hypothetical protein